MSCFDEERERPQGAIASALWCNRCMLPSGMRWPFTATDQATGRKIGSGTFDMCVDCGGRLDPDGNVIG